MKELNFNFGKLYWELFQDNRLTELSNDGIILYTKMLDKMNLSRKRDYTDENGVVFILFTEKECFEKCRIKKKKFFELKKKLKELGLIHYDEQKVKKAGVSTPIYVKHYELWSKEFVKVTEDNNKVPEDSNENAMDVTQNVTEDSTIGLEETGEEINVKHQQNGFGIHEMKTSVKEPENEIKAESDDPLNDRYKIYVQSDQYGKMVEVYRYIEGNKDDLSKRAAEQGLGIIEYLNKVEKHYGVTINYI